jgi:bifunctional UDP-N-acetylglucosamine pyrophosphorylase/glucosamine-1-phosphate N-acetyltransferase
MRSAIPKVLHEVAGRPMLARVLDVARAAGCDPIVVVVGHGGEAVRAAFADSGVVWAEQREQKGTGHALAQAAPALGVRPQIVLVLSGDVPLLRSSTLERLLDAAASHWGAMAVASLDSPGRLGRVLARPDGTLDRIVEAADASPEELAIRCVNAGLYALPSPALFAFLERLNPSNAQGELYLTDALGDAVRSGERIALVDLADPDEALGVNDREDLARVHRLALARKAKELMASGVTLLAPERTAIEPEVEVGADTTIHPDVTIRGATRIGGRCTIGQGVVIRDCRIVDDAVIEPYSVLEGAEVGAACRVGPFARLRAGTVLETGSRVGNFVETKKARIGRGAKASHLAYLGDAEVGAGANIGAGAVTCNFDGVAKHRTVIGEGAFIGSDTMLVAPIEIGAQAMTAAGSVITKDVPAGALAIERAEPRVFPGWAARRGRAERPKR